MKSNIKKSPHGRGAKAGSSYLSREDALRLDPGIADAVMLLQGCGVNTFASCEGGEGHAFNRPTIRIKPLRPLEPQHLRFERDEIASILAAAGYGGFYIKLVHCYQMTAEPWQPETMSFIEVEFWAEATAEGETTDE